MSIHAELKQVSTSTLELLKHDLCLIDIFFTASWSPQSAFAQNGDEYDWELLETQFLDEWEIRELDLNKSFRQLNLLLAGYVPGNSSARWTVLELETLSSQIRSDFLPFLVIENSQWDGLPLVNAIGAGTELDYDIGYGALRYLMPNEVEQVLDGLQRVSDSGFQERFRHMPQQVLPFPWDDWSEEVLEGLTNYYSEMVNYYEDASTNQRAMLLYLT
jgi:hypothetical protein